MLTKKLFYPNRQKLLRLLLVVLIAGLMLFGLDSLGALNWARSIGERAIVLPMKQFFFDWRNSKPNNGHDYPEKADNTVLKLKISQLTEENDRLVKMLGFEKIKKLDFVTAKINDVGADRITISSGSNQGVVLGMMVIVAEDQPVLLGKVNKVTPNQSEIALLSEYDNHVSVVILSADNPNSIIGRGLATGRGAGTIVLEQVLNQEKINPQDIVSYQFNDDYLLIGYVGVVSDDRSGIFQVAKITPAINPYGMLTVFLLK